MSNTKNQSTGDGPAETLRSSGWFAEIAALWEDRPERLADVTEQIRAIHAKLVEWDMEPTDRDELDHATIAYSRVVVSYECVQWLPFDLVPNWEDDLYCVLLDEDRWQEAREKGQCTSKLADELRALANDKISNAPSGAEQSNQQ